MVTYRAQFKYSFPTTAGDEGLCKQCQVGLLGSLSPRLLVGWRQPVILFPEVSGNLANPASLKLQSLELTLLTFHSSSTAWPIISHSTCTLSQFITGNLSDYLLQHLSSYRPPLTGLTVGPLLLNDCKGCLVPESSSKG